MVGPKLGNLNETLTSLTQQHASALGLIQGEKNLDSAQLNAHAIQRGMELARQQYGTMQTANSVNMPPNTFHARQQVNAGRLEAVEKTIERLNAISEACARACPACGDDHEEDSLLDDYERRFCIEGDYADDDEEHPVGSALVRMEAALKAHDEREVSPLVTRQLDCPHCRRNFGEIMLPKSVAITYKVNCKGCELEGRR